MKLGGCQVVIKCGNTTMREFVPTVSEGGKQATCWIASQPGKVSVGQFEPQSHGKSNGSHYKIGVLD